MWPQSPRSIITAEPEAGLLEHAMREWFAVQVWASREASTACHLQERGYEVFLPTYEERRRRSDRVKAMRRALFAGYVFCRSQAQVLDKIITTPGVVRIVGDGHRPLSVSADEISAVQRLVAARLDPRPWPFLHEGQKVRIEAGPLSGVEGIVVRNQNEHRLVVAITLLQRSVSAEIDKEWVVDTAYANPMRPDHA